MRDLPTDSRARTEAGKMEVGGQKIQTTDRNAHSFLRDPSEETMCTLEVGCIFNLSWNNLRLPLVL